MKKAVMYGAGNIGRGFIGKTFSESGYEVCFIDVKQEMIDQFNQDGEYRVHVVSNEADRYDVVKHVYAVNGNTPQAIQQIADCNIMATAVGIKILPYIIDNIVQGMRLRMDKGGGPINIILAENQMDVDMIMRRWIYKKLNQKEQEWADKNLGLVEASIGRMVPPLTKEEQEEEPLLIAVEPYEELPVDRDAFKGVIPDLKGLIPYSPFGFYIKRKLFIHNMGHAICAYLGWLKGCWYIWEAIRDPQIYRVAENAMIDVAVSLHQEYDVPLSEIVKNVEDLLKRFGNQSLKDTTERVAADPIRKLRKDDRLTGAALYCLEHDGRNPLPIITGIVAALHYSNASDPSAVKIQQTLREMGLSKAIEHYLGVIEQEQLIQMIKEKSTDFLMEGIRALG